MADLSRLVKKRRHRWLLQMAITLSLIFTGLTTLFARQSNLSANNPNREQHPAIPPDVELVKSNTTSIGSGKHYWICNGATLTHTGARNVFYVEEGGQLKLTFGGGNRIYLSQRATLSLGSGADNMILKHPESRVIRRKNVKSNRYVQIDSLHFDYVNAPAHGCRDGKSMNMTPLVVEVITEDVDKVGFKFIGQFRRQLGSHRYLQEYKEQRKRFRIIISNSDPDVKNTPSTSYQGIGYTFIYKASDSDRGTYLDSGILEIRDGNLGDAARRLLERFRKAVARFPHKLDFQSLDSAQSLPPAQIAPNAGEQDYTEESRQAP